MNKVGGEKKKKRKLCCTSYKGCQLHLGLSKLEAVGRMGLRLFTSLYKLPPPTKKKKKFLLGVSQCIGCIGQGPCDEQLKTGIQNYAGVLKWVLYGSIVFKRPATYNCLLQTHTMQVDPRLSSDSISRRIIKCSRV